MTRAPARRARRNSTARTSTPARGAWRKPRRRTRGTPRRPRRSARGWRRLGSRRRRMRISCARRSSTRRRRRTRSAPARRAHAKNVAEENAVCASAGAARSRSAARPRRTRRPPSDRTTRTTRFSPRTRWWRHPNGEQEGACAPTTGRARAPPSAPQSPKRSESSGGARRGGGGAAGAERVASHHENTRRAQEMNAERVEQFRAEQRAAVLATVLGQRAEKHGGQPGAPSDIKRGELGSSVLCDGHDSASARETFSVDRPLRHAAIGRTRRRSAVRSRSCDVYELLCSLGACVPEVRADDATCVRLASGPPGRTTRGWRQTAISEPCRTDIPYLATTARAGRDDPGGSPGGVRCPASAHAHPAGGARSRAQLQRGAAIARNEAARRRRGPRRRACNASPMAQVIGRRGERSASRRVAEGFVPRRRAAATMAPCSPGPVAEERREKRLPVLRRTPRGARRRCSGRRSKRSAPPRRTRTRQSSRGNRLPPRRRRRRKPPRPRRDVRCRTENVRGVDAPERESTTRTRRRHVRGGVVGYNMRGRDSNQQCSRGVRKLALGRQPARALGGPEAASPRWTRRSAPRTWRARRRRRRLCPRYTERTSPSR